MVRPSSGELLRRWYEDVWNRKDSAAIHTYMAPGCVLRNPGGPGGAYRSPEDFAAFHAAMLRDFPDMVVTVHQVVESGPMAVARWSATATPGGPASGAEPLTITGMSMVRVEDGSVVEAWDEWDRYGFCIACGLVVPAAA
jgi:predicted SnoaL-like aldol condensation-catalyzing enzyme